MYFGLSVYIRADALVFWIMMSTLYACSFVTWCQPERMDWNRPQLAFVQWYAESVYKETFMNKRISYVGIMFYFLGQKSQKTCFYFCIFLECVIIRFFIFRGIQKPSGMKVLTTLGYFNSNLTTSLRLNWQALPNAVHP